MASNHHFNSGAVTDKVIGFPRAVNHLNIFVETGITFEISFDGGVNFLEVPPGFTSMPVGPIGSVIVTSDGAFQLVGVQA